MSRPCQISDTKTPMTEYQIQLPVFEGPLDLLLHLVEREELDITKVALAQVTDQYLSHMAVMKQQARDISDFVVVAAKLLLIKSIALLPRPPILPPEAEDVGDELVRQLQAYKQFKKVASILHRRQKQGLHGYVRVAPLQPVEPQLDMSNVSLDALLSLVREALDVVPAPSVEEVVKSITVTIDERMSLIETQLTQRPKISFREVLTEATSRVEVIVTLLAILELIKQKRAQARQEEMFGEIIIERHEEPVEVEPDAESATSPAA